MHPVDCPACRDHTNRLVKLEKGLEIMHEEIHDIQKTQKSPVLIVALIGLFGTCIASLASFAGSFLMMYVKAKGWL